MYKWANTILTIDTINFKWVRSLTGRVQIFRRTLEGLTEFTQAQTAKVLRGAFAKYFLDNPKALVISHVTNYPNLTNNEKDLVSFIVTKDGYLTVNFSLRRYIYVQYQLKESFQNNFIGKCATPASKLHNYNANIYKDLGVIPYTYLYRYKLTNTFPSDNFWFNSNTYTINVDYDFPKRIAFTDGKKEVVINNNMFTSLEYEKDFSSANLNTIKKFNNFDKEAKNINVKIVRTRYEHLYFLYDNDSIIRETCMSELIKKVHLIGSITFYDEINKQGKAFLISNESKLKFDVKKNVVIDSFNFNLSHTNLSGKIDLKKKRNSKSYDCRYRKINKNWSKKKNGGSDRYDNCKSTPKLR